MPFDLPTTLNLAKQDLASLEEFLNGLKNLDCSDDQAEDKAAIQEAIKAYEQYGTVFTAMVANLEAAKELGYPKFRTFRISTAMKARLQTELKASTVAEGLFVGTRSAVSGPLNFSNPIAQNPK